MKSIVNSEIESVAQYKTFKKEPYPNSDYVIGRETNPTDVLRNFAENLLLYDKIYIVTTSFEEVMTLKDWLGGRLLQELLYENALSFVQLPFAWTYIQKWKKDKGIRAVAGIANIFIADPSSAPLVGTVGQGVLQESTLGGWSSSDLEKAVSYTLTTFHKYNPSKIGKFSRLVASHSIRLNSEQFRGFITKKSGEDLHDAQIVSHLGFSKGLDMDNVPGNTQDIRRVFRIILANQNIAIMNSLPESDLLAEQFHTDVLKYPLTNEIRKTKLFDESKELFKLEKLPFPEILGFQLPLVEIIKLRNSREGVEFRKWLHEHLESREDIKGAYVELLKRKPPFLYRVISTIATPAISIGISALTKVPGFVIDSTLGAVSEFKIESYAERFLTPNPPKFFMEKVKDVIKKREQDVA